MSVQPGGFGEIAAGYDGFIIDLWGVVHNGVQPLPGVLDCLARLRTANKPVIFLTNAPRRAPAIARVLAGMGVADTLYAGIMSSGEAVHEGLATRAGDFAALGQRLYHLGPKRDRDVFEGLGYIEANTVREADFILNTGPDDELGEDDAALYEPVLQAGLAAGLPMICANPDLEVLRGNKRILCAGLLAQTYAQEGGKVIHRGKPDPAIYQPVLAKLGLPKPRVLAVGDSLRTDIAGAKAAGLDACWVLSGIHALHENTAANEAAALGLAPKAILPGLGWSPKINR